MSAAENEAKALQDDYTSVEHVLLAMAQAPGEIGRLFRDAGVTRDSLLKALREVRGNQRVTTKDPEGTYKSLERYGRDLTLEAERGKLDPVIGRDDEIRRIVQVLSRRTKNNPGADRRAGRRQDGDRRRLGAAHRARRRSRRAEEQARRLARHGCADRRREISRRVRRAAQGGAQRSGEFRGPNHAVRRRTAYRRRRGQGRRLDGRGQPAQTDARARRTAHDRRDDARRIPQIRRERCGARTALSARLRRSAQRRGHDFDSARAEREVSRRTTAFASRMRRWSPRRR